MVVKYLNQSRVAYGDRNFFAILAAGNARSESNPSVADDEIDRFLRFAEPPDHDEWISTENLREQYKRGFRTALDDMFDSLREALRHLVANRERDTEEISDRVLKRFPIHGSSSRRPSIADPSPAFELTSFSTFEDNRWKFGGTIETLEEEFDRWTVDVSLTGIGEDGSQYTQIPIELLDAEDQSVTVNIDGDIATLIGESSATKVEFSGASEPVNNPSVLSGVIGETQLELKAELMTPNED